MTPGAGSATSPVSNLCGFFAVANVPTLDTITEDEVVLQVKEPMLTTEEAARFLKLSPHTVRKYVQRKLLIPKQTIGTAYLFLKSECSRYRKERRPRGNPKLMK